MPGSLLNLQDLHSDLSDVSSKSVDSRASGKKVSFNKAVRVKQYPEWQPDDHNLRNGLLTSPSQRFWFKVYKSNPHQEIQNSWKDRIFPSEECNGDALDSLMPIAEDDDSHSDINQMKCRESQTISQPLRFDGEKVPPEPPVDYVDDDNLLIKNRKGKLASEGTTETNEYRNKSFEKSYYSTTVKKGDKISINGTKTHDFKRPTISSAAKCISESKAKIGNKQATTNTRFQRTTARDCTPERLRRESPQFTTARERRSISNDNQERGKREIRKTDKAVSTDDLSFEIKENQENLGKDKLLWPKNGCRDKATQLSGTLTKGRLNSIFDCAEIPLVRTALSTSNQPQLNKSDITAQIDSSCDKENVTSTRKENYFNQNSSHTTPSKALALFGKNCLNNHQKYSDVKTHNVSGLNNWRESSCELKTASPNAFDYDYVIKDRCRLEDDSKRSAKNTDANDEIHKPFPWRTVLNRRANSVMGKTSNGSREGTKEIRGSSTTGFSRGAQVTTNYITEMPKISIPKLKNNLNGDLNRICYTSDQETSRGRHESQFRRSNRERSASSDRGYQSNRKDNDQFMIDWSLSGFHFGSRQDSKLSYSSDSECVVHRRPPLLMYIPGVSHHNRPAIEDDRMSGISRSEAEDEISPLACEFKRRHSMPRNGKLNWMRRKANKKILQQSC